VGIHHEDLDAAIKTYQLLSERWFTHASPTLFNAGTPRPQMSSCFLICMKVRRGLRTVFLTDKAPCPHASRESARQAAPSQDGEPRQQTSVVSVESYQLFVS